MDENNIFASYACEIWLNKKYIQRIAFLPVKTG